jgi:3-deoxy-manno-octulosonate cytidylyltransferase (CMP-KDO synthetase)
MIQHVYEKAMQALEYVCVATDDERISEVVASFGGNVVMTSPTHRSGTDRVAEAAAILEKSIDFDIVVNIQGDEPFIHPEQIENLKSCFEKETDIATLVKPVKTTKELLNPNKPKVVIGAEGQAMYFSRSPIPFVRGAEQERWIGEAEFWAHIGMYAYRKEVLQIINRLPAGKLEIAESLEQLRWLENGFRISTAVSMFDNFGIDTPEDLQQALQLI